MSFSEPEQPGLVNIDAQPGTSAAFPADALDRLAQYATIVRESSEAIFTLDRNAVITSWNKSAERMYGYSPAEIVARPASVLLPRIFRAPDGMHYGTNEQTERLNLEHVTKSGVVLPVSLSISPLYEDDGTPHGFLVLARDLTELLLAQSALAQSEVRLREVEGLAHVGSWSWDATTGAVQWSSELHAIRKLPPHEFDGSYATHVADVHPDDREAVDAAFQIARQSGAPFEMQYRIVWPSGEVRYLDTRSRPILDSSGAVVGIRGICQDITERQESELKLREAYDKVSASVDEMERRNHEQTAVGEMADMLQSCLSAREAYGIISAFAVRLFPHTKGAVFRPAQAAGTFEGVSAWGGLEVTGSVIDSANCWALRRGRPHRTMGVHNEMECGHARGESTSWTACLPLIAHGELLGLLHICQGADVPEAHKTENPDALESLEVNVMEHLALALANLELRDHLKSESERDGLTGLYNRRYMDGCLKRGAAPGAGQGALSLLLIDVDNFKELNDRRGHAEGDAYLRALALLLLRTTRAEDTVCRYGGDEFALIIPQANRRVAMRRGEQLRSVVAQELERTISIGVASIPEDGSRAEELFLQSDMNLYEAKLRGRNQVVGGPRSEKAIVPTPSG
ncbi:MAG: diguanylate cyclase [Acidimicrobiales bacterium]